MMWRILVLSMLFLVACGGAPEAPTETPTPTAAPPHQQYLDKAESQLQGKEFAEAAISAGIARDMAERSGDGVALNRSRMLLAQAWLREGEYPKAAGEYGELSTLEGLTEEQQKVVATAMTALEEKGVSLLELAATRKGEEARKLITQANELFDKLNLDKRRVEGRKKLAASLRASGDRDGARLVLEEAKKIDPGDKEIANLLKKAAAPPPAPKPTAQAETTGPGRAMTSEEMFRAPAWLRGCWFLHSLSLSGTNGGCFLYFRQEGDVMWGAIVETQLLTSVRRDGMGREISRGVPFHRALYQHNLKGKIDGKNYFFRMTNNSNGVSGYMQIKGNDITGKITIKKQGVTKEFKGYRMKEPMEIDVQGKGTLTIPAGR